METLIAIADRPEDWRETMPTWAHMAWWALRKANPMFFRFELVSFVPAPFDDRGEDGGYVIIRLANVHVPAEHRTTFRYLSRSLV